MLRGADFFGWVKVNAVSALKKFKAIQGYSRLNGKITCSRTRV
jgi:hypothetical protein